MPSENKSLPITIEFGGGAESLFDKKKKHEVNLPAGEWKLKRLLHWIKDNLLKERLELFMQEDTVRPGILVLVNDTDWELLEYLSVFTGPRRLRSTTERHRALHIDVTRWLRHRMDRLCRWKDA
ncbi:ubiquitin-related modifier 1 isoform X2 [Vespa velutina]|uniref:ubiquitin-related modifier 1 isoform X2 n=1 Tax=Vespa velutina TaxID=202808 RepID=UPI001FB2B9C2|nr:ubiquitin-related modifier 1 isoform X2 [Vespa velutina]